MQVSRCVQGTDNQSSPIFPLSQNVEKAEVVIAGYCGCFVCVMYFPEGFSSKWLRIRNPCMLLLQEALRDLQSCWYVWICNCDTVLQKLVVFTWKCRINFFTFLVNWSSELELRFHFRTKVESGRITEETGFWIRKSTKLLLNFRKPALSCQFPLM